MNKIEIQLSKKKMLLLLIGAIVFVTIGIFFIINPDKFTTIIFRNPQTIRISGIAAFLFFSAVGIYGLIKLFDESIGLTIDENGITDNSNATSVGLIEWNDIVEIKTEQIMSTRFLLIFISNPDKYLDRVNRFQRKLMQGNLKKYGTPLSIISNSLKCNFNELESLVKKGLIEQQGKMPNR